jgi:hypothetical protein
MKSDLTRLTFNQAKHYRAVQQQQGRVQLDADWNEQLDITGHRIETETVDTIGTCGAPLHDDGFRLVTKATDLTADEKARPGNENPPVVPPGDLLITAGRFYAGGVLAENDRIVLASAQPDLPTPAQLTKLGVATTFPPKAAGTYLAYLDVWPRLRTAIDDPQIREVALGGPDSATRIKNTWQVKFLLAAAGDDCASPNDAWDALLNPKFGTLAASVAASASAAGPCIVDPGSGYRRLENQLYRVEVHMGGDSLSKATFKWSRDNGSIVTRWIAKQPLSDEIEVETTGRDKVLNIAPGHWVELTDDTHEELGLPGTFALVTNVSGNIITIDSAGAIGPVEIAFFPKNPKVRRWDSAPAKPGKWLAPDGEKTLNSVAKFELEDGVVVEFGVGTFRTGDYWLIPARTALPFVEWPTVSGVPVPLPPQGVTHHYCKLAIVKLSASVFTITDCRHLFPPLTELTSLFYVSGESQEATPDPTKPPATLLPLALPLKVGGANGEWPVAGARVRFKVKTGGGKLTPAPGIVTTGSDGIASCNWSLDSLTPDQEVIAELLDDVDARVHLPVIFHARLNTANLVSYDPAKCEGMKNAAPPVVTVQDALDFLCHEEAGVECCVTVGELGNHAGNYKTVAAAIEDLLGKRKYGAICLSLLPGDHLIDKALTVAPVGGKKPTYFKIAGCSHASRLIVNAPLMFKNLEAVVIRDISIRLGGIGVGFDGCHEVEISDCLISGRSTDSALLNLGRVQRFALANNMIQAAGDGKPTAPWKLLKAAPMLAKMFELVDERDFASEVVVVAEGLTKLPRGQRASMAKDLRAAVKGAYAKLTPAERKAYAAMLTTLDAEKATPKTLVTRLEGVRDAGFAAGKAVGTALTLLDFDTAAVLADNQIDGLVSLGGEPAPKPFTEKERKDLGGLIKNGTAKLTATDGTLHLRGNVLLQIVPDKVSLAALRKILAAGKGTFPTWSSAHCTDNIIGQDGNYFVARHLSLSTTRFLETDDKSTDLGVAVTFTATYVGNSAETKAPFFNLSAIPPAQAANQGLNLVILP